MIPISQTPPVFDLLVALVRSRAWEFDKLAASAFTLHVPSLRFDHTYKFDARGNDNQDSLSFDLSCDVVVPWKMHRALQATTRRLNLGGGLTTFSFAINAELKLRCGSYLGRTKSQHKAKVVEKKLDDALVRMDCGWDAIQLVAHTGKDPIDAVELARLRAY